MSLAISWDHSVLPVSRHKWTQFNTPHINPARYASRLLDLPTPQTRRDLRLSWPRWLVTYRDGLPTHRRSPIQVATHQCTARPESNSQPVDHMPDALTIKSTMEWTYSYYWGQVTGPKVHWSEFLNVCSISAENKQIPDSWTFGPVTVLLWYLFTKCNAHNEQIIARTLCTYL